MGRRASGGRVSLAGLFLRAAAAVNSRIDPEARKLRARDAAGVALVFHLEIDTPLKRE